MKVAFLSKESSYFNILEGYPAFKDVFNVDGEEAKKSKADGMVIDEDALSIPELIELKGLHSNMPFILIAKAEYLSDKIKRVCLAHDIDTFPAGKDSSLFLQFVQEKWMKIEISDYKNVIAVIGTHPQVGVTQTALSIGQALRETNRKACVIGLNFYNAGELSNKETEYSFDTVYPGLSNQVLNQEKLKEVMVEVDGLHYLVGNRNYISRHHYTMEPIKQLIDMAKSTFDYVVLDLGSHFDTAGAFAGLKYSDSKILVTTQQIHSVNNFNRWYEQVLKDLQYDKEQFLLVVNKYVQHTTLTPKQLSEQLEISLYGQVPFLPGAEDVEIHENTIYQGSVKPYIKAIGSVAKGIALEKEFPMPGKKKKLLGIFG